MKAIIVGLGSIGARHLNNLLELGVDVCGVDVDPARLKSLPSSVNGYAELATALEVEHPDIAFICTLSNQHIAPATLCARRGCHLFIEKPLSTDLDGVDNLISIAEERNLVTMVGCNMRFHPAIEFVHETLTGNPAFGRPLWANLEVGYYLPFAKPDYRRSYQANKNLGGDLIFDCIHELDYAGWLFGAARKVFCAKAKLSTLDIDTADFADILIEFDSGLACNVHMDYLQHGYSRRCKVVAEGGTLVWDFSLKKIGVIESESKVWRWHDIDAEIYFNRMYVDEARYFLDAVSSGKATFNSIAHSVKTIKIALAANRAVESGAWEFVEAAL